MRRQKKKYPEHVVPSDEEYARLSAEAYRQLKDAHSHLKKRRPTPKIVLLVRQWTKKFGQQNQQRQSAASTTVRQKPPETTSALPSVLARPTSAVQGKPKQESVYTPEQMERDRRQLAFEAAQRARERQLKARFFELLNSPIAYGVAFVLGVFICWYMAKHR